jgi:hypothetical protein
MQDLVPYFQNDCSMDEIRNWLPSLSSEEIAVAEKYYRDHRTELDEQDVAIRARTEEQIRQQRLRFPEPEGKLEERKARLRKALEERLQLGGIQR